eukprot:scaffold9804_cov62-Phaeocystis_antarctica.AAC.2
MRGRSALSERTRTSSFSRGDCLEVLLALALALTPALALRLPAATGSCAARLASPHDGCARAPLVHHPIGLPLAQMLLVALDLRLALGTHRRVERPLVVVAAAPAEVRVDEIAQQRRVRREEPLEVRRRLVDHLGTPRARARVGVGSSPCPEVGVGSSRLAHPAAGGPRGRAEPGEAREQPQHRGSVHPHQVLVPEEQELLAPELLAPKVAQRVQQADRVEARRRVVRGLAATEALVNVRGELGGGQLGQQVGTHVERGVAALQLLRLGGHRAGEVLDR